MTESRNRLDLFTLDRAETALVIVDVQERLAVVMEERQQVLDNCRRLIEGAKILDLPVAVTEQYPKGLGPTEEELRGALLSYEPFEKITFSCCGEPAFNSALEALGRKKILLAGMETHVCVLQTGLDLLRQGYVVHLVGDAVCSRDRENRKVGLELLRDAGAVITSTETVLFQLLGRAGTDEFKAVSKLVK
jgi:nicotinamidase-related amidase